MMKVIQEISDKTLFEKLLKIVEKQINFIGSKHDHEKIRIAIKNALENNRTVFFVKTNETMFVQDLKQEQIICGLMRFI